VIDITKLRDYKWCSRGILVAVFRCGSRWSQSEFRSRGKGSALDGALKPSSPLTGSTGADRMLGEAWRTLLCRWPVMLVGCVGVLAFLSSAILPDDDAFQQEFLHSKVSLRVVGRHAKEVAGNVAPVHVTAAFWPAARPLLVRRCVTCPIHLAPVPSCGQFKSTTCATRAPPASV
jgi:hypothetical protein